LRILLDTCVSGGVRKSLSEAGHDVVWATDWPKDRGDEEILRRARQEARVLVTLDKDFGELAIVRGRSCPRPSWRSTSPSPSSRPAQSSRPRPAVSAFVRPRKRHQLRINLERVGPSSARLPVRGGSGSAADSPRPSTSPARRCPTGRRSLRGSRSLKGSSSAMAYPSRPRSAERWAGNWRKHCDVPSLVPSDGRQAFASQTPSSPPNRARLDR
jgi:hypothetical protein